MPYKLAALLALFIAAGASAQSITNVAPSSGPTTGGTVVTLTGTNLVGGCTICPGPVLVVVIGGITVTPISYSETQVVFTTPPHVSGPVDVTWITYSGGQVTVTNGFRYDEVAPVPTLSARELALLLILLAIAGAFVLRR